MIRGTGIFIIFQWCLFCEISFAGFFNRLEHNHLQDLNLRVCNREVYKCLELNSTRSDQSLLGEIFSLQKPTIVVFDSRTMREIERIETRQGYWDLPMNRIVLQKSGDQGNGLVEVVIDLDSLKKTTFVMK